jgi:Regulator of G protein signaling domain
MKSSRDCDVVGPDIADDEIASSTPPAATSPMADLPPSSSTPSALPRVDEHNSSDNVNVHTSIRTFTVTDIHGTEDDIKNTLASTTSPSAVYSARTTALSPSEDIPSMDGPESYVYAMHLSLDFLVRDPLCLPCFAHMCESEHSEEGILFWHAVERYRTLCPVVIQNKGVSSPRPHSSESGNDVSFTNSHSRIGHSNQSRTHSRSGRNISSAELTPNDSDADEPEAGPEQPDSHCSASSEDRTPDNSDSDDDLTLHDDASQPTLAFEADVKGYSTELGSLKLPTPQVDITSSRRSARSTLEESLLFEPDQTLIPPRALTQPEMNALADQIYQTFIAPLTQLKIALDHATRSKIEDAYQTSQITPHMFTDAQAIVFRECSNDILPRFWKTSCYRWHLQNLMTQLDEGLLRAQRARLKEIQPALSNHIQERMLLQQNIGHSFIDYKHDPSVNADAQLRVMLDNPLSLTNILEFLGEHKELKDFRNLHRFCIAIRKFKRLSLRDPDEVRQEAQMLRKTYLTAGTESSIVQALADKSLAASVISKQPDKKLFDELIRYLTKQFRNFIMPQYVKSEQYQKLVAALVAWRTKRKVLYPATGDVPGHGTDVHKHPVMEKLPPACISDDFNMLLPLAKRKISEPSPTLPNTRTTSSSMPIANSDRAGQPAGNLPGTVDRQRSPSTNSFLMGRWDPNNRYHCGWDSMPHAGRRVAQADNKHAPHLERVLEDPNLRLCLRHFCEKKGIAVAQIRFLIALQDYNMMQPRTKDAARTIFTRYIIREAEHSISLGAVKRDQIDTEIKHVNDEPPLRIFAEASHIARAYILEVCFSDFLNDRSFLDLIGSRQCLSTSCKDATCDKPAVCCVVQ